MYSITKTWDIGSLNISKKDLNFLISAGEIYRPMLCSEKKEELLSGQLSLL